MRGHHRVETIAAPLLDPALVIFGLSRLSPLQSTKLVRRRYLSHRQSPGRPVTNSKRPTLEPLRWTAPRRHLRSSARYLGYCHEPIQTRSVGHQGNIRAARLWWYRWSRVELHCHRNELSKDYGSQSELN